MAFVSGRSAGSARSKPRGLAQGAVQPVDQRIDIAAMTLENGLKPLFAIEPSAEGTIHDGGALSNVTRCLRRLRNLPQDRTRFHKRARIFGRTLAGELRKGITPSPGFLSVHRCDPYVRRSRQG